MSAICGHSCAGAGYSESLAEKQGAEQRAVTLLPPNIRGLRREDQRPA
jgi:hypothetical protein